MYRRGCKLSSIAALGFGILGFAAKSSRADFEILVFESGGPQINIVDNGPLDTDNDPDFINVNTPALNTLLVDFGFRFLGVESNRITGNPFSNDPATLSQTGIVMRSTPAGTATITIAAFDTDFLLPAGNPRTMTTSASDTFRFTTAGDSRTFQSVYDTTNFTPPSPGIPSPLLAFVPPIGVGPFSTSNLGVNTPVGIQPIPFGISNTTVITLGPNTSSSAAQHDQFTGGTAVTVTAVPEPASACLLAFGLVAFARYRSRTPRP